MASFLVLCLLLLLLLDGCVAGEESLLMVQILYRHGDRSPVRTFPTNPLPESAWPQGFGQLTQRGMDEHYQLGKYFRSRYIEGKPYTLLNASYCRHETRLRSTDFDRTLMSAYSNLAGLYPPAGEQVWKKDLLWQPIPVHTIPKNEDYLLDMDIPCAKYDEYYQAALNSEDVKKEEEENKEFYKLLANKTGNPSENVTVVWKIYDSILCARIHGLKEPDWANMTWKTSNIFDKMSKLSSFQYGIQYNQPGEGRFRGGPLIGEMLNNMKSRMNLNATFKSYFYSAHDSTVSAFLSAMKVFNQIAPPYTAAVLVELHRIDSKHFVRILYRNDSTRDPYHLQIPGCDFDCPLDDFERILKDNIPHNWHSECRGTSIPKTEGMILLAIGIILFSVLIVTILIFALIQSQRRRRGYVAYDGLNQKDEGTF